VSLLAVALSLCLSLGVGAFTIEVGRVASSRGRAQIAADAAALAAAAESGPYGHGDPELQAANFARANGARLVECLCDRGATAMQVEVAIGDVSAKARAVLDPSLLRPAPAAIDTGGLNPQLAAAVRRLLADASGSVHLVSGYRSRRQQTILWERALNRYGNSETADNWVAPPGASMHERGLAVDLGGDLSLAVALIAREHLPLWRPLPNEPWHFELVGTRGGH
jgi:zinc D-Ala-D-Ala carboxypeptidase